MKISLATRCAVAGLALAAVAVPAAAGGRQTKPYDPFGDPVIPKVPVAQPTERVLEPPALAVRQSECKSTALAGKQVESLPCMYLVREVTLQGVFRTEDQPEAFLFAEPTKQTITVRVGDKLFDGRVLSIDEPGVDGSGQIVLEKVVKKQIGKKVTETKERVTLPLASAGI